MAGDLLNHVSWPTPDGRQDRWLCQQCQFNEFGVPASTTGHPAEPPTIDVEPRPCPTCGAEQGLLLPAGPNIVLGAEVDQGALTGGMAICEACAARIWWGPRRLSPN